jgi:hypothetical protein
VTHQKVLSNNAAGPIKFGLPKWSYLSAPLNEPSEPACMCGETLAIPLPGRSAPALHRDLRAIRSRPFKTQLVFPHKIYQVLMPEAAEEFYFSIGQIAFSGDQPWPCAQRFVESAALLQSPFIHVACLSWTGATRRWIADGWAFRHSTSALIAHWRRFGFTSVKRCSPRRS